MFCNHSSNWPQHELFPHAVDRLAREQPHAPYGLWPAAQDSYDAGFRTIDYAQLANLVNGLAWWLKKNVTPGRDALQVLAYIGPNDVRITATLLASIKAGNGVSLFQTPSLLRIYAGCVYLLTFPIQVCNLRNSHTTTWAALLPSIVEAIRSTRVNSGNAPEIVPPSSWLKRLSEIEREAGVSGAKSSNAAAKLLDFYRIQLWKIGNNASEKAVKPMEISQSLAQSAALRGMQEVSSDWVRKWVNEWITS